METADTTRENQATLPPDRLRLLVVDDEKRIRNSCARLLTQEGHAVDTADTGNMGIEMIEKEHYDIILLDLMMPGISGMEALAKIRSLHPDTVIIVITGYATLEHSIEAMKKGAFDFLSKPFSPNDLRAVIAKANEHISTLHDIKSENSRLRVLLNHLGDGVLTVDMNRNIVLANPSFLQMMHHPGGRVIGRPLMEFMWAQKIESIIDEALRMPADKFSEAAEEISPAAAEEVDGKILNAVCVPFRDRIGRNLGAIIVLQDITALKKIDQLKSEFVSLVAHEIRSPMSSVQMQLKVILDELAGPVSPKQMEILSRASEKIGSMVKMSSELLDLAKIESGLITQEKETLDMGPVLEDQVQMYLAQAQAKSIDLKLDAMDSCPPVFADRMKMEEVLSNLISNAIKYTPENGRIRVSASEENGYLCIQVQDSGFGMSEEDLEHIFDKFYRVKNAQTRYIIGTGLGLSIVKSIVESHNGLIRAESQLEKGSTFKVCLPKMEPH
jgi:two-component system phosphate regulon sensor histidine kinase PhoR